MKQFFICLFSLSYLLSLHTQTTTTFESFDLASDSFLDGSDNSGGFSEGNIFLPNTYDFEYNFWSGWAISSGTDTLTAGFTNQYSAIAGSGYDNSNTYAVTYASPASNLILTGDANGGTVAGFYVTNSTYAYLSMLNGDGFAKKFGGETGDDADFFLLTIKKYLNGNLSTDSIDFYLADYRFEDNTQDYIVKEWTYIDVSTLGDADSLQFSVTSSDVGQYGINTPAYFCLDQITTLDRTTPVKNYLQDVAIEVFPNPASEGLTIHWPENKPGQLTLSNGQGQILESGQVRSGNNFFDLKEFPSGFYTLVIRTEDGWTSRRLAVQ